MRRIVSWALLAALTAAVPGEAVAAPAAGAGGGQIGVGMWMSMSRRAFTDTFVVAYRDATSAEVYVYRDACVTKKRKRKGKKILVSQCTTTEVQEAIPSDAFQVDPLLRDAHLSSALSAGTVDLTWTGDGDYPTLGSQAVAHPQFGAIADVSAYRDATAAGSVLGAGVDTGPVPTGEGEIIVMDEGSFGFAFLLEGAGAGAVLEGAPERVRAAVNRLAA